MTHFLGTYVVLYRDDSIGAGDPPLAFECKADDADHAVEQCEDAYPGCDILWVRELQNTPGGDTVEGVYLDYWTLTNWIM
jgi:hypothetical protein